MTASKLAAPMMLALAGAGCEGTVDSLGGNAGPGGGSVTAALEVPAARHWVNSGFYLRPSDSVTLSARGAWTVNQTSWSPHGPEGIGQSGGTCAIGELVGIIGFDVADKMHGWQNVQLCIGPSRAISADRAGILYLGANDDDWAIGDGRRTDNAGSAFVTISTDATKTVTLQASELADFDLAVLDADVLEVRGTHVLFEQTKAAVAQYQSQAKACLDRYDALYRLQQELSGGVPENGDPIRFALNPSSGFAGRWGQPIQITDGGDALADCGSLTRRYWVWAHTMGHSFHLGMNGRPYMIGGDNMYAAFANLSVTYSLEKLGLAEATRGRDKCATLDIASYQDLVGDPWSALCLLLALKDDFGWAAWQAFFRNYHQELDPASIVTGPTDAERWAWFRDTMNAAAGVDVTPVLLRYHVPLP